LDWWRFDKRIETHEYIPLMFALTPEVWAELSDELDADTSRYEDKRWQTIGVVERKERESGCKIDIKGDVDRVYLGRQDVSTKLAATRLSSTRALVPRSARRIAFSRHDQKCIEFGRAGSHDRRSGINGPVSPTLGTRWCIRLAPLLSWYADAGFWPIECNARQTTLTKRRAVMGCESKTRVEMDRRNDCFFACVAKAYEALVYLQTSASTLPSSAKEREWRNESRVHETYQVPGVSANEVRAFCAEALVTSDEAEAWWLEERSAERDRAHNHKAPPLEPPLFTRSCKIRREPLRASWYVSDLRNIIGGDAYCGNARLLKRLCDHSRAPPHIAFLVFTREGTLYPYVFAPPALHKQLSSFFTDDVTPSKSPTPTSSKSPTSSNTFVSSSTSTSSSSPSVLTVPAASIPPSAFVSDDRPAPSGRAHKSIPFPGTHRTPPASVCTDTTNVHSSATTRSSTRGVSNRSNTLHSLRAISTPMPLFDVASESKSRPKTGDGGRNDSSNESDNNEIDIVLDACRYALLYHTVVANPEDGTFDYHWQLLEDEHHRVLFPIDHPLLMLLIHQDVIHAPKPADEGR
jgi:hypothetical protein